jgi:hypothetical protein
MVPALGAASLATSVIGAGAKALFGNAADRQRRRELDEQLRRFRKDADQQLGGARLTGAALGVEGDSASLTRYLLEMDLEFQRQERWMRESGEKEIGLAKQAGMFDLASGIGGALVNFASSQNWWQKPPLAPEPASSPYSGLPDYLRRP